MRDRHKQALVIGAGVLLSAAALGYFVYRMWGHWGAARQALAGANYLYVIPSVGFIALMYALRMLRWRVFLNPIGEVRYSAIASATCIGFMSSCLLPLRPGEIIRPYVLHRKAGVSFGHAAGTAIGLERAFDLMGVCFLLLLTLLLLSAHEGGAGPASAESVARKALWFAALTAVGFIGLLALAFAPGLVLRVVGYCLKVLPRSLSEPLMGFLSSMAQSMRFLRSPGQVATATLLSLAIWFCFPLSTYSLAMGFDLQLTFAGALLAQVIITAAVVPPQAPGFLGVFHAAAMEGVKLSGVSQGDAGAFAMMLWAVNVIPITIVGLGFLQREGWSLRNLAQASQEAATGSRAAEENEEP